MMLFRNDAVPVFRVPVFLVLLIALKNQLSPQRRFSTTFLTIFEAARNHANLSVKGFSSKDNFFPTKILCWTLLDSSPRKCLNIFLPVSHLY